MPPGFRFLVKAHELCTIPRFGSRNRYNAASGEPNPKFLDAEYAIKRVIAPAVEGLRETLGPIVFQFAPLRLGQVGGAATLTRRLGEFLAALPRGPLYAVEIRNRDLLTPEYVVGQVQSNRYKWFAGQFTTDRFRQHTHRLSRATKKVTNAGIEENAEVAGIEPADRFLRARGLGAVARLRRGKQRLGAIAWTPDRAGAWRVAICGMGIPRT